MAFDYYKRGRGLDAGGQYDALLTALVNQNRGLAGGIAQAGQGVGQGLQVKAKLDAYTRQNEQERIQDAMLRSFSQKMNYDFAVNGLKMPPERAEHYLHADPHEAGLQLRSLAGMEGGNSEMSALEARRGASHALLDEAVRKQAVDPMDVPGLRAQADYGKDLSPVLRPQMQDVQKKRQEQATRDSVTKKLRSIAGSLNDVAKRNEVFGYVEALDDLALGQDEWEKMASQRMDWALAMDKEQKAAEAAEKASGKMKPGAAAGSGKNAKGQSLNLPPAAGREQAAGEVMFGGEKGASPSDSQLAALGKAIASGGDMDSIMTLAGWDLDSLSEEDFARLEAAVSAALPGKGE